LALDIACGVGDDRDGWYGAAEARLLAYEVLRQRDALIEIHENICGCEKPGDLAVCVGGSPFAALAAGVSGDEGTAIPSYEKWLRETAVPPKPRVSGGEGER
jgi:hypothetical protein